MKMIMRVAMLALVLVAAGSAFARSDVRDGNAMVKPQGEDKYSIDGFTMGKAELFGYISELKETQSATGIVLKRGGNDEQRRVIGSIARTLQLKAFEQDPACVNILELDIRGGKVERGYLRAVNIAAYDLVRDGKHLMVMEKIHRNYAAGRAAAEARMSHDASVSDALGT